MFERFSKFVLSSSIIILFVSMRSKSRPNRLVGHRPRRRVFRSLNIDRNLSVPTVQATVTLAPSNGKTLARRPNRTRTFGNSSDIDSDDHRRLR